MNGSRIICTPQSQFILTKINHSWDCIELIFLIISYTCSILYTNYGTLFFLCLFDRYLFPRFPQKIYLRDNHGPDRKSPFIR